jgi:hypothetical protein
LGCGSCANAGIAKSAIVIRILEMKQLARPFCFRIIEVKYPLQSPVPAKKKCLVSKIWGFPR